MPKNVFDPKNQGEMNLKRNAYDLSKSSVFTTDFFKLYPHFCQEVIPGDTFEIDAQVGFRALPTTFPLQTRVRVSQEFYYCRDRTLQDDFEDMIFKTKEIEHPWLRLTSERAKKMISLGSLGDAFNVPSSYASNSPVTRSVPFLPISSIINSIVSSFSVQGLFFNQEPTFTDVNNVLTFCNNNNVDILQNQLNNTNPSSSSKFVGYFSSPLDEPLNDGFRTGSFITTASFFPQSEKTFCCLLRTTADSHIFKFGSLAVPVTLSVVNIEGREVYISFELSDADRSALVSASEQIVADNANYVFFYGSYDSILEETSGHYYPQYSDPFFPQSPTSDSFISATFVSSFISSGVVDATDDTVISFNPFVGENPQIRLNVLPFRAYTQLANYYYRFDKNNPYVLNGEAQYNEFIPTHASGPDDNEYDFHYRNWELDRFTSALQSPQFGQAPLVGLIWTGDRTVDLTFSSDMSSDGQSYKVTVGVDDGDNIESILDFSGDVPSADLQRLQRSIQAGLSINDLRVTNSFQRFLENVMRRGLRYRNQLKSHFGVSVDYPDIDIPQYIGGSSSYFDSGQVTNMAQGEAVLGDYNGTLQGGTATTNKIRCYCPEHGYIIGIVSITPIPSYAQSISKHMIKHDPFDYFTPEFGKIGFTPIHYSEISPLQNTGTQRPSDVFGYQKAWYDYMEALDEVHGDFRTTLRDFVLSRTFAERPQLSESFTVGSPDQLNDVFVTTKIADKYGSSAKFLGSARFHVRALRPIPMIGTPSLE